MNVEIDQQTFYDIETVCNMLRRMIIVRTPQAAAKWFAPIDRILEWAYEIRESEEAEEHRCYLNGCAYCAERLAEDAYETERHT